MYVFLVCQVFEICILVHSLASSRVQSASSAVLIRAISHIRADGHDRENIRTQNCAHAEWIEWCLVCFEELRCDNIGDAVCDEDKGIDCDLLGMTTGLDVSIPGAEVGLETYAVLAVFMPSATIYGPR
jgi:hypothetical protein